MPHNVSALYDFILSTRNTDGGFAEHPDFTSNNAYTFVAFWMLRQISTISGFNLIIPANL